MIKFIVSAYRHNGLKKAFGIPDGCCLYAESCSHYAERIIDERGELAALPLIILRMLRCNTLSHRAIGHLYKDVKFTSDILRSKRKTRFVYRGVPYYRS